MSSLRMLPSPSGPQLKSTWSTCCSTVRTCSFPTHSSGAPFSKSRAVSMAKAQIGWTSSRPKPKPHKLKSKSSAGFSSLSVERRSNKRVTTRTWFRTRKSVVWWAGTRTTHRSTTSSKISKGSARPPNSRTLSSASTPSNKKKTVIQSTTASLRKMSNSRSHQQLQKTTMMMRSSSTNTYKKSFQSFKK